VKQRIDVLSRLVRWLVERGVVRLAHEPPARPAVPRSGRSSQEDTGSLFDRIGSFNSQFDTLTPIVPFEVLDFLEKAALTSPDMAHVVNNIKALANNGHEIIIVSDNDNMVEAAQQTLNERAQNIYPRSAGVDGLINHYIDQLCFSGAISSEDVANAQLNGVEKVVFVPTPSIRFRYIDGEYRPFQKLKSELLGDNSLIPLNDETYRYYAFRTFENQPYAVPMFVSSIEPLLTQMDMQKNVKYVMRKFGLLGLVAMALKPPTKMANETGSEFETRKKTYLNDVVTALQDNFFKGLMVTYNDQEIQHHNITGEARGAKDVWDLNEEQMASSMLVDPLFMGRAFNTTETFGNVVYRFIVGHVENVRRLVKRRMERTYELHLRLAEIFVDDVIFAFNPQPARDPLATEEAFSLKQRSVIERVQNGMIPPDVGAQELGYDNWFDVSRLDGVMPGAGAALRANGRSPLRFRYDQGLNRYRFIRQRLSLPVVTETEEARDLAISKKRADEVLRSVARRYRREIDKYLEASRVDALRLLRGWLERSNLNDFANEADFARQAFAVLTEGFIDAFNTPEAKASVRLVVDEIYDKFRIEDLGSFRTSPDVTFTLDAIDQRSKTFMREVDRFYLGKYIFNDPTEASVRKFLEEQFLESGDGLFGRTSREALDTFIGLASDRIEPLSDMEAQRIINTSVQRMRTWGNIGQLDQAGFEFAELFNPSPEAEICKFITKPPYNIIPIGAARKSVDEISRLSPEQFRGRLQEITPALITSKGIEQATLDGEGFPPFHPNCKTQVVASKATALPSENRAVMSARELEGFILVGAPGWLGAGLDGIDAAKNGKVSTGGV